MSDRVEPIDILLVDDDPCDVLLTKKALERSKLCKSLSIAKDGVQALEFLHSKGDFVDALRPDLILLDLNMPRMDGREVLQALKADDDLKQIPVIVLTTSDAEQDVIQTFDLHENSYLTKPANLEQFTEIVDAIEGFWQQLAALPPSN